MGFLEWKYSPQFRSPPSSSSHFTFYPTFWFHVFQLYVQALFWFFLFVRGILYIAGIIWCWKLKVIRWLFQPETNKKRLVIVGGGYAGVYAATYLEHLFETILIDPKHYFEFTPSKLRSLVEPQKCQQIQKDFHTIFKRTKLIPSKIQQVTTEDVTTEDGEVLPYDYLLLCTGSRYSDPIFPSFNHNQKLREGSQTTVFVSVRTNMFTQYHNLLLQSQRVVIIGGGTVGVELAAEIIEHFPQKQLTLIHSNQKLIHRSPSYAIQYAESYFIKNGVRLILGQKVVVHKDCFFATDKGVIVEGDLAFICTGNIPNTEFMKSCFADKLTSNGYIRVNDFLQLNGYRNIFVAGDITYMPQEEEKLCQTAGAEVNVAIKNLKCMLDNTPLHKYVPTKYPMVISLGKVDGIFTYRGFSFSGFFPAMMKEFVEWKEMVWYWDCQRFFPSKVKHISASCLV